MSIIHVNQIKTRVTSLFQSKIDLTDLKSPPPDMQEDFFLTRGLAAYAIYFLSGITPEEAALSVTDGGDDNGLDAIYYHESNNRLYLVQSKWIKNGVGEPENGDIKKFVSGVRDLFNLRFERFNDKVRSKQATINVALNNHQTRYEVVVVHTGASQLSIHSKRDIDDLADEFNDVSDVLTTKALNQSELHKSLAVGITGEPICLDIGLKSWGRIEAPHEAFYGQISADQVADWWGKYRKDLLARNLRGALGETEVNAEIRQTLEKRPDEFWYFNNGITLVAKSAKRTMAGGSSTDFSTFHCDDVSVVNGAQTVSSIGKFGESFPDKLGNIYIPIRVIVRGENLDFADDVTRTNNRQNKIENRDFVTLDPEQSRIRTELAIDGVDYQLMRSDALVRSDSAFDLVEATTALACASCNIRLAVQLKREIGKLWDDITRTPYKEIFNPSVPGIQVWRCVQIQRRIDKVLEGLPKRNSSNASLGVITHGNRLIALLVFDTIAVIRLKEPSFDIDQSASDAIIIKLVDERVKLLDDLVNKHYPNAIIPTLFKNLKKCELLVSEARQQLKA